MTEFCEECGDKTTRNSIGIRPLIRGIIKTLIIIIYIGLILPLSPLIFLVDVILWVYEKHDYYWHVSMYNMINPNFVPDIYDEPWVVPIITTVFSSLFYVYYIVEIL